jgi:phosphate transport system protein
MTKRPRFDRELQDVRNNILRAGSQVEQALVDSMRALELWDNLLAQRVIALDQNIDDARTALEEDVLMILATQQPVADDLRLLQVATAIMSELERMGDYAKRVSRETILATRAPALIPPPSQLQTMGQLARCMLRTSLDAFVGKDCDQARSLSADDEKVDELEDRIVAALIAEAQAEPQTLECVLHLLNIAHALERFADRATNIGERVIYLATHETEALNP